MLLSQSIYPFDPSLQQLRELREQAGRPFAGSAQNEIMEILIVALTLGTLLHCLMTFGEEFGWRGYLLPRLMQLWGAWPGLLAHGVIWGLWHTPDIVLIGLNYPRHRLLGVLLMAVSCLLLGVLLGWLRLVSGSIWPSTIAHSAFNQTAALPEVLAGGAMDSAIAGTLLSPVGWLALLLAVAALLISGALPRAIRTWQENPIGPATVDEPESHPDSPDGGDGQPVDAEPRPGGLSGMKKNSPGKVLSDS